MEYECIFIDGCDKIKKSTSKIHYHCSLVAYKKYYLHTINFKIQKTEIYIQLGIPLL